MSFDDMALRFAQPWALLLLPMLLLAWWQLARRGYGRWWRLCLLLLLAVAALRPQLRWGGDGSDLIVVLDRSASMGEVLGEQEEILHLLAEERGRGDRLALISCGAEARVVQGPQQERIPRIDDAIDGSGSDLVGGLERAASLLTPGRSVRVLLHSDGEFTGRDPRQAVAELGLAGARVDVLPQDLGAGGDAAVLDIELPSQLRLGSSLLGAVRFLADRPGEHHYRIMRNERLLQEGTVHLQAGRPLSINFADRPSDAGLARYRVELDAENDARPGNNVARAALRVLGGEEILVVSGDGSPGNIARVLAAAGMRVRSLPEGPVTLDQLSMASALVLDQVPADRLGRESMQRIAQWVRHLGGGLFFSGGRRSFGAGGYHKSAIEEVLPVTMELRDEHRKLSVAMAIALDRSGSMAATVAGGETKMDLADRGAAAAVELLGANDDVAVFAVDSAPHSVVPLQAVVDRGAIIERILSIESMGGGIYVYEALAAAAESVLASGKATRHIVLFADAADAEEPGDYQNLCQQLQASGVTISVIGLGSESDADAALLKDVAKRGGGRCQFTDDPNDLPRLFAQETVLVARSAWVDGPVASRAEAPLQLLFANQSALKNWPQVDGYNLSYARPQAQVLASCLGDPQAPALAAWHCGSGRAISLALAADDASQPRFMQWPGYAPLLASSLRWLADEEAASAAALRCRVVGNSAIIELELDPERRADWPQRPPPIHLVSDAGESQTLLPLAIDDGRYQATVQLDDDEVLLPAARIGERSLIGPALQLPYAPEFAPRFGREDGGGILADIARIGGGELREDLLGCFDNPPSPGGSRELADWLLLLALVVLIAEVAVRRLQLAWRRRRIAKTTAAPIASQSAAAAVKQAAAGPNTPRAQTQSQASAAKTASSEPPAAKQGMSAAMEELRKRRGR